MRSKYSDYRAEQRRQNVPVPNLAGLLDTIFGLNVLQRYPIESVDMIRILRLQII